MFKKLTFASLMVLGIAPSVVLTPAVAWAALEGVTDVGNTLCPVSGERVNPQASYVHEGKRYLFCCKGCVKKFKKNPGKYIAATHGGHGMKGHEGHSVKGHEGHAGHLDG